MVDNSVIKKTGQWWKLVSGFVGLLLGAAIMYYGIYLMRTLPQPPPNLLLLIFGGIALGFGAFGFQCIAIKCPDCGVRWFWATISTKGHKHFLIQALGHSVCPGCGNNKGHDGHGSTPET